MSYFDKNDYEGYEKDVNMDDDICEEELPEDTYLLMQRQRMRELFPQHEVLALTEDEYLVLYHGLLREIDRITAMLEEPDENTIEELRQGTYLDAMHEKEELEKVTACMKSYHECLPAGREASDFYLVPMVSGWEKHIQAFLRGASLLFRETTNQLIGGITT